MEQISYKHIMQLGFTETEVNDPVYFDQHGYKYAIIEKKITKNVFIQWHKDSRLCEMYRIDSPKTGNIMKRRPIQTFDELKDIINFYTDEK